MEAESDDIKCINVNSILWLSVESYKKEKKTIA